MLTDQQKKERKTGLGGSEIAAILGLSPWATAMDIYLDKINPEVKRDKPTKYQERGSAKEDQIADKYAQITGNTISIQTGLIRHPEHSFAIGSIDRWVNDKEFILECKTTHWGNHNHWGEQYTDQIPDYYLTQVAWYAFVCDKPRVDIALLIGDDRRSEFKIYRYDRNLDFENKLFILAKKFWHENVLAKKPPVITSREDASKLYTTSNDASLMATGEIAEKVNKFWELKTKFNDLDNEMKSLEADIKSYMGENAMLTTPDNQITITWKQTKPRTSLDTDSLKKAHPDIYNNFLKEGKPYRTFIIKSQKEGDNGQR